MGKIIATLFIVCSLALTLIGFSVEQTWAIGLGFVLLSSGIIVRLAIFGQDEKIVMKP